ncbi:hypothetical protein PFICI_11998 [Pestalotiopsis fici W106-1]|uniref:Chromo domain-containing protein n=1 Tax=Pestalotiopsis fici (strain W106-1 / CGMCC3.15140) TaxID=1229662 RepID=W3WUS3_PESFW|nr:uncharacterized protein PFICI_11998 [Pestalotiopsis fici W106-1]ETS76611.1 hypothetical protein PFICI_11998 [Pestalotiopsis fici W106-1]
MQKAQPGSRLRAGSEEFECLGPLSPYHVSDNATSPVSTDLIDPELLRGAPPTPPTSIPEACSPLVLGGGTPGDVTGHRESTPEPPSYAIDCILERWKKDVFLVRWLEYGSSSWVPRSDILDDDLLEAFENNYSGYQDGVEMARAERHSGRTR